MPVYDDHVLDELLRRLRQVLAELREEGVRVVHQFLDANTAGVGGVLVLQAPCRARKRDFTEAAYRSERFGDIL